MTRAIHALGLFLVLTCAAPGMAHAQAVQPASPAPAAPPAPADAASDPVRQAYEEGNKLYDQGRHAEAEAAYERAWAIHQSYDVALQLGAVELDQKKYREAAEHLAYAQASLPTGAKEETRKTLATRLALALKQVGVLHVTASPQGAEVLLDGAPVGRAPLPQALYVDAGPHTIAIRTAGEAVEQKLEAAAGSEQDVRIGAGGGGGESALPVIAGVGFGLGGAGVIAAIVLTSMANSKSSDLQDESASLAALSIRCDPGSADLACADVRSHAKTVDTFSNAAMGMWIASGVLVLGATVGTAALAGGGERGNRRDSDVAVVPYAGPGCAGLMATGRF
jgi:tetratricopeptide (TPR) repeat protein